MCEAVAAVPRVASPLRRVEVADASRMLEGGWADLFGLRFEARTSSRAAAPVAMFVVDAERQRLVLVRVVTANASNTEAEVHDLYSEGSES